MDVFDLSATLSLDTSKYETGLSGALGAAKNMGGKLGSALKVATLATGALVAAGTAVTGAFVASAKKTADYGDKIDKMSQKIGISAEAYQKWDYVMKRAGGSIDSMKMGMKTLSSQAEKNSDAFQKLGISQEEVANLSQEELFEKTVKGLAEMEQGTERATLASQLLGRAGADMGPLLNEGSKAIEEQMEIAEKYGMVMPDAAVKASAAFEDSLTTMQMTFTGLKNRMMGEFLPAMTQVTDGMAKLFAGDDSGADDVAKGIENIVKKVAEVMPKIIEIGANIATKLATSFINNIKAKLSGTNIVEAFSNGVDLVVATVPEWIEELAKKLSDNAPVIAEQGAEIMIKLGEGIIDALPQLISAAGQIQNAILRIVIGIPAIMLSKGAEAIGSFVLGLLKKANNAATAGAKIVSKVVNAIKKLPARLASIAANAISSFVTKIANGVGKAKTAASKLASGAINALKKGIKGVADIGFDIVRGIGKGITNGAGWIKRQIRSFVGNVKSFLKGLFKIGSPSKWARDEIGKMIDAGLAIGISSNADMVEDAMDDVVPDLDNYTTTKSVSGGTTGGAKFIYPVFNSNVVVDGAKDPEDWGVKFADAFERKARAL